MAPCTVHCCVQYSTPSVYRLVFFLFRIKLQHLCPSLSTSPCVPHGRPILFSFISSSEYYYRSSTNHEIPNYAISSSVLSLPPLYAQISPSAPHSHTPSVDVFPLMWERHSLKSHIKLQFCMLSSSHFQMSNGRFWTELQQATTKRGMTCPVSTTVRRQNLCEQLFAYSPPYTTLT